MKKQAMAKIVAITKNDKQELATHRVELALVDDINNLINDVEETINLLEVYKRDVEETNSFNKELSAQVKSQIKKTTSLEKRVDTADNKADKIYQKSNKILDKADQGAKSLGVSPKEIGNYSRLKQLTQNLNKINVGVLNNYF
jgi:methyl-accepting chemotaxis protein